MGSANFRIRLALRAAFYLMVLPLASFAQPPDARPKVSNSSETVDYSKELPRIAPRSPEEALQSFHVLDGFRMELVAAEPLVVDPIAICFDADGTLYAVEMRGYSEDESLNISRIRQLKDLDGDGRYETSSVFANGFGWPTAITCYNGGVYVAVAPNLLYLQDTDHDGKADRQELVYQGFGKSNVQGLVNTFQWGPDQRIHGVTSSSGAELRNESASVSLTLRGRDFAFDARTRSVEPMTGGGQHGMTFDDWGNKFVCANSDHIQQVMYEDRYWHRNPFIVPPPARVSIASDGPQADVFRTSDVEPWRRVRTRLRVAGIVPGPVEGGGRASGYFTSATGLTIYRGDAYPEALHGLAFVADVGSNLIHRKRLSDTGIEYRADRIDEGKDFITSDDIWFRPVQMANGPDGCLYIVDMYREVIEHPASLPPEIKQHLDLTSGRDRGRIYRVVPPNYRAGPRPDLAIADPVALVAAIDHPNAWHQETAARLLFERSPPEAIAPLKALARTGRATARWRALRVLDSLSALTNDDLKVAMRDGDSHVRCHAVQLSEKRADQDVALRNLLIAAVDDKSLRVRYQLAFSLGELKPVRDIQTALAKLIRNNLTDRYIVAASQSSLAEGAGEALIAFARDGELTESPSGQQVLRQLARQLARQPKNLDVAELFKAADPNPIHSFAFWSTVLPELAHSSNEGLTKQLRDTDGGKFQQSLLERAREQVLNTSLPVAPRQQAMELLTLEEWSKAEEIYRELFQATQPRDLQESAFQSLRQRTSTESAELMVSLWPELSPQMRTQAMDWLPSFAAGQNVIGAAIASSRIPFAEITAAQRSQLAQLLPAALWKPIEQRWQNQPLAADREALFVRYRQDLAKAPDLARGRDVFRKTCSECHRLDEAGFEIGPNLASLQNRGAESILVNVLEPNREVNPQYVNYVATTLDGRIMTGMIQSETATSLRLLRAGNQADSILRSDLESLRSTGLSLMPSNLEQQIAPEAMADLIGYILSVGR